MGNWRSQVNTGSGKGGKTKNGPRKYRKFTSLSVEGILMLDLFFIHLPIGFKLLKHMGVCALMLIKISTLSWKIIYLYFQKSNKQLWSNCISLESGLDGEKSLIVKCAI